MEELAEVILKYGDVELLATAVRGIDEVDTVDELVSILEDELSYMSE